MMRRVRIVLGIIILTASLALLIWAYKPLKHETRIQSIAPADLQLPTPVSFLSPLEFVS